MSVPMLRRVSRARAPIAEQVRPLVLLLPGIESANVSWASGSVLVHYDPTRVSDERVVAWMTLLSRLVADNWPRLSATSAEDVPRLVQRFASFLEPVARRPRPAPKILEIPPDVWR
jgi:hypothetical protein